MNENPNRLRTLFTEAPLYAILDTAARPDLPPLAILGSLLRAGVKVVQYRHKAPFHRAHWDECCDMARLAHDAGALFFVNDRADIAKLCGADGVHLGQDDLPPEKARLFAGEGMLIGYSTHTLNQAESALRLPIDYLAIGPVFPTSTKANPDPVVGLATVKSVRAITAMPLIAIGGITIENAPAVLDAGADAVAVIRDLLAAPEIESRAREFLAALLRRQLP